MTILEAIKSGKPFKRAAKFNYYTISNKDVFILTYYDIIADDWEVEEKKIEVTETQLRDAYHKAYGQIDGTTIENLVKLLGFKN